MTPSEPPRLSVRVVDGVAVARLADAEILFTEAAVQALGAELFDLVDRQGHTKLVVDLTGVKYLSSAGLAKLTELDRRVRQVGGRLRLCGLGPTVRDVFRVSQLDRLFAIDEDEAASLARFPK
jgi:anti-sigma B factor antagonist